MDMNLNEIKESIIRISENSNKRLNAKLKFIFDDGVICVDDTKNKIDINNIDCESKCSIKISNNNFHKLIRKELNVSLALINGDITIEGDMSIAIKISELFE
jgi:putative sterol carrier protein